MQVIYNLMTTLEADGGRLHKGWGKEMATTYLVSESWVSKMKTRYFKYLQEDTDDTYISAIYGGASGNPEQEYVIQGYASLSFASTMLHIVIHTFSDVAKFIKDLVLEYPYLYIREVRLFVREIFDLKLSKTTIWNFFARINVTHKKISPIASQRLSPECAVCLFF